VPRPTIVSYAQNREDVVLWRALVTTAGVEHGTYVEVGANDPTEFSISRTFYDHGWSGVTIEPVAEFAARHRDQRPRDRVVQAAVTDADVAEIALHVVDDTGLSTLVDDVSARHTTAGWSPHDVTVPAARLDAVLAEAGLEGRDIHFLMVDVEGAESAVIASVDLDRWRPWVLVVEATAPLDSRPTHHDWEPTVLAAGYEFCLFDGLSRFYVAREHSAALKDALGYPACPHDDYVSVDLVVAREERDAAEARWSASVEDAVHWRTIALTGWADALARTRPHSAPVDDGARRELEAMRRTLSWRVTRPLRSARGVLSRARRVLR